jgi:hypothetical protein
LARLQDEDDPRLQHRPGARWQFRPGLAHALEVEYRRECGEDVRLLQGPHAWWNWRAYLAGSPARDSPGDGVVLRPLWIEYHLFSDAALIGSLDLGPYKLILGLGERGAPGRASAQLIVRAVDHLAEPDSSGYDYRKEDVAAYYGGDEDFELAAILALALGRRLRSSGPARQSMHPDDPGFVRDGFHVVPTLIPPRRESMLPGIGADADLSAAASLLARYPRLSGLDAVALVRAASQYADALWLADADPRLAWLKLVAAAESAAGHWKAQSIGSPVRQLKRHRRRVWQALKDGPPATLRAVAEDIAHTFRAEEKFKNFLLNFAPPPPESRPSPSGQVDWDELDPALAIVYEWRSNELHAGIPFPGPLCEPPIRQENGVTLERFAFLASSRSGATWPAERLPMHFHVFAHLVGGALKNWWQQMPAAEELPPFEEWV